MAGYAVKIGSNMLLRLSVRLTSNGTQFRAQQRLHTSIPGPPEPARHAARSDANHGGGV
jgi:hypothetical protein